jgi:hypothetical protein
MVWAAETTITSWTELITRKPIQGVAMVNPAIDSLQEMKITTNSYDAEFGTSGGSHFPGVHQIRDKRIPWFRVRVPAE